MKSRYWMMLNWDGKPMPHNPAHAGWSEIDWFTIDSSSLRSTHGAGPTDEKKGGEFSVGIRLNSPTMSLAQPLALRAATGGVYSSVAVDLMATEGAWVRYEFRNASPSLVGDRPAMHFDFEYERVQVKQITLRSKR